MAGLLSDLLDILEIQAQSLNELLLLSKEKTDVLVENDSAQLKKITELEMILSSRYSKLDKNRKQIMDDIALVLNIDENPPTLTAILKVIEGQKEAETLSKLIDSLLKTAEDLKTQNERNEMLITNAIDYLDFTVNVIKSSKTYEPTLLTKEGKEIKTIRGTFDKNS